MLWVSVAVCLRWHKTTTPPGAVSASITASTSAAAAASSTATAATLPSADPRRDYTKAEEAAVFNWCVKHASEAKTFTLSQVPKLNNQPFWVCVILNDGAGAVDVQLPSTREVNTYATDGGNPTQDAANKLPLIRGEKYFSSRTAKFGRAAPS